MDILPLAAIISIRGVRWGRARQGVALKGFAHNPQALLAPNGSILLFHIGQEEADGCLADCMGTKPSGANPHPAKLRPKRCKSMSHAASGAIMVDHFPYFTQHVFLHYMQQLLTLAVSVLNPRLTVAIADSPEGPFTRFPYAFPSDATNPTAMLLPNGTVVQKRLS